VTQSVLNIYTVSPPLLFLQRHDVCLDPRSRPLSDRLLRCHVGYLPLRFGICAIASPSPVVSGLPFTLSSRSACFTFPVPPVLPLTVYVATLGESSRSSIMAMSFEGNIILLPPPDPSKHPSINCPWVRMLFLMNVRCPANVRLRCLPCINDACLGKAYGQETRQIWKPFLTCACLIEGNKVNNAWKEIFDCHLDNLTWTSKGRNKS
jgi:hypothetical protein